MKVSIIIPTYKPGDYIKECLDSIIGQTLLSNEFEIIIVLNGPKDPYYQILEEYIARHDTHSFKLIYTDILGVSNARNIGIDNAKGEYITFVDDDDIISAEYLKELLAVSNPTCIGVSNGYAFYNDIKEKRIYKISNIHTTLKNDNFSFLKYRMYLSSPVYKIIHRAIIGNTRFNTSMRISEDSIFCFTISKNIREMKCADSSAIYYVRIRKDSATRRKIATSYIIRLTLKKLWLFTKIYLSNPLKYNFPLYASRIMASIKHAKVLYNDSKKYNNMKE